MCAWVSPGLCKISHALCVVDNSTLAKVFGEHRAMIDKQITRLKNIKLGSCQIMFSLLFTERGIKVTDYSHLFHTPFWNRHFCVDCSISPKKSTAVFIPLQMIVKNDNNELPIETKSEMFKVLPKHHVALQVAKRRVLYKGSPGILK